jgi:O-antigen/teichoic acid export membrane protein
MAALIVLGGTRVLYGAMISRVTDRETFGMIGMLTAITVISSFALPAGVATATSRFVPFNRGHGDSAAARGLQQTLSRFGAVAGGLLSIASATGVLFVLHRPIEQSVEVGLLTLTYSLYTIDKAALYGFGRVSQYLRLEILGSGVALGSTIIIVISGATWYLVPFVFGYFVFIVGARLTLRKDLQGEVRRPRSEDRREIIGYIALACLGTLASAGFLQGTQLLAAHFAKPTELAYFTAAVTLVGPLYLLPRALGLALFPSMSEAHGAGDWAAVRRHADLTTRALLAALAPVFVVAVLLAPELLTLFGGAKYAEGAGVLQIILAATYLSVVQIASVNALSSGSQLQLRTPVGWSIAGCLCGLVAVVIGGGPLGATGVGVAYLLGTAVTATGCTVVAWRRYEMPWAGPMTRAFVAVAGAVLVARLLGVAPVAERARWLVDGAASLIGLAAGLTALRGDLKGVLRFTRPGQRGRPDAMVAPPAGGIATATVGRPSGQGGGDER